MEAPDRGRLGEVAAVYGLNVDDVYPRPAQEFDREYWDERLEGSSGLEWSTHLPRRLMTAPPFEYVVIFAGGQVPDEGGLRSLAAQVADECVNVRYVAVRLTSV